MVLSPRARLVAGAAVFAIAAGGLVQTATGGGALWPALLGLVGVVVIVGATGSLDAGRGWWTAGPAFVLPVAVWGLTGGQSGDIGWFVVVIVAGYVALGQPLRRGLIVWGFAIVFVAVPAISTSTLGWLSWVAGISAGFWGSWLAGHRIELVERVHAAEAAAAAAAAVAERQKLAHDLHDVVAHTLAVTVLHLGGARLAVRDSPAEAAAAIEEAERLARRSLDDLRSVVRVLGEGASGTPGAGTAAAGTAGVGSVLPPQPGAPDVAGLVDEYRRAGLELACRVRGDPAVVSGPRGLVLFRIVQEALANVGRHAPDHCADIDLAIDDRGGVELCVANPCPPSPPSAATGGTGGAPSGMGLVAMRERVAAVGGRLDAGSDGTTWVVRAALPA